jgi:hypothetical protein
MEVVHLARLKTPRKAAGQMGMLAVPSVDSVHSKLIQVKDGKLYEPPLATAKAISIPQSKAEY